jgi:hypothetical protein
VGVSLWARHAGTAASRFTVTASVVQRRYSVLSFDELWRELVCIDYCQLSIRIEVTRVRTIVRRRPYGVGDLPIANIRKMPGRAQPASRYGVRVRRRPVAASATRQFPIYSLHFGY